MGRALKSALKIVSWSYQMKEKVGGGERKRKKGTGREREKSGGE